MATSGSTYTRKVRASVANATKRPESLVWQTMSILNQLTLYRALGNPGFAINTNFDVANANALSYLNNGVLKTLAATTVFDTGTTKVIAANRWGIALLSLNASGAAVLTWAASDFATEAAAIAALSAVPSANTPLGYVTVLTGAGVTWTAGTDALQGGTGGTPSVTTKYTNGDVDPIITTRELGTP